MERLSMRMGMRVACNTIQDPTRSNHKSQFPEFYGKSTPKVDSTYLSGKSLERFLFTSATRKI